MGASTARPDEDPNRERARSLQRTRADQGDATGWFDDLYREAGRDATRIPWAHLAPNPLMTAWLARSRLNLAGLSCLVTGCGLGDDAEFLASAGGEVTACDIAPSAIAWCRDRFPASAVRYTVADLLAPPPDWRERFAFVLDVNTVQALPLELRAQATPAIAGLVRPGGTLLVICRGRDALEQVEGPPWPLSKQDLGGFAADGALRMVSCDDLLDGEDPPVRRFVAVFSRSA